MGDLAYSVTVEILRGTDTDDRDKMTVTVEAEDIEQLDHKVSRVRERMEEWADEFRAIQPRREQLSDEDQAALHMIRDA